MDAETSAVVLAGGDPIDPSASVFIPDPPLLVVAADSGLQHAATLGLDVDVVIGDMDSVDPSLLASAEAAGAEVHRYPDDKDATDLELALRLVASRGASRVVLFGGRAAKRLDHFLANALVMTSAEFAHFDIDWHVGTTSIAVVRDKLHVQGRPNDIVTLLPVGGSAAGVTTSGLRWELDDEPLSPGTTRGVSNRLTGETATIVVSDGTLLVIHERNPE